MRQTLFALVILSACAAAQNVLAIAPGSLEVAQASQNASAAMPPVGSLALLLSGLAGLTVAGRRVEERVDAGAGEPADV